MAEALRRWLREEMEAPPAAIPSQATLRRLCSGPRAPIWDFVTRHVRSLQNVQKIRGNLRWYGELQELKVAASPPSRQGALRAELSRRRKELQALREAISGAQEAARRLEASLEALQSRRWAELRRGAELRLLGAEPDPEVLRGCRQGALQGHAQRPGESRAELSAILAAGAEPEVLVAVRAVCKAREEELQKPRPPRRSQEKLPEAPDWREMAEAALIGRSPAAVLWALETLANQSTRELLRGHAHCAEATPTMRSLIQDRWAAMGSLWASLPPLQAHLAELRAHLSHCHTQLAQSPPSCREHSLSLRRAALEGFLASLTQNLQQLSGKNPKILNFTPKIPKSPKSTPKIPKSPKSIPKSPKSSRKIPKSSPKSPNSSPETPKSPKSSPKIPKSSQKSPNFPPENPKSPKSSPKIPKSPEFSPKCSSLGKLRRRLQRRRGKVLQQQQQLRFLSATSRGRRAALRAVQEQAVGVARAGLSSATPPLAGEGQRRRLLLGALGALGEPLPPRATPPLLGLSRALGLAGEKLQQGALLPRLAALRLRLRRGALSARRGAWPPPEGAWPEPAPPPAPPEGVAELLAELRLVAERCRQRLQAWPRLQGLVGQWWSQPAQFASATPPGRAPFSHWLRRWRDSARALGTPLPEVGVPEVGVVTPGPEVGGATALPEAWLPGGAVAPPIPEVGGAEVGVATPSPEGYPGSGRGSAEPGS